MGHGGIGGKPVCLVEDYRPIGYTPGKSNVVGGHDDRFASCLQLLEKLGKPALRPADIFWAYCNAIGYERMGHTRKPAGNCQNLRPWPPGLQTADPA